MWLVAIVLDNAVLKYEISKARDLIIISYYYFSSIGDTSDALAGEVSFYLLNQFLCS